MTGAGASADAGVLALLWAGVIVAAAVRHRPPPARIRALGAPRPGGHGVAIRYRMSSRAAIGVVVGVVVGVGVAVAAVAAAVVPGLALLGPVAWWARPRWQARAEARRARAAVEADLPEVVDLLRLAVASGLTVPLAVAAVGRRGHGPVARALAAAAQASAQHGRRLADALDDLPTALGEPGRALAATLAGSERYGHAIGPALERLAAEARDDQRRRAEAAARRVPVLLLFPLVLCVLPAFALLTVAPLIAGALRALRL